MNVAQAITDLVRALCTPIPAMLTGSMSAERHQHSGGSPREFGASCAAIEDSL